VVVNKLDGKFASAHDLRRSFATRWAARVKPATLQLMMRHADIKTTLDYYVDQDADEVAAELWASHEKGNRIGNSALLTEITSQSADATTHGTHNS
jgi:integrase